MDKRTITGITVAAVLGIFPAAAFFYCTAPAGRAVMQKNGVTILQDAVNEQTAPAQLQIFRRQFQIMGTVAAFTLYCPDEETFQRAVAAGIKEFEKVSQLANLYDKNSELSRLNASAYSEPFPCSYAMWQLITRAERAFYDSNGGFDITVKPLMDLWGFYRKRRTIPSEKEIASAKMKVGFDKLKLDHARRMVSFTVKGMALDLGGIAKGYALDRAFEAINACGVTGGVLDLGGNLKLLPSPPPGKKFYTVGIKNPADPSSLLQKKLQLPGNSAVSTSGDYERFVIIDNRRYGHIIDPRTGFPAPANAVTVTTTSAMDADIFSTTAYLENQKGADKLKANFPGTEFYFTPGK